MTERTLALIPAGPDDLGRLLPLAHAFHDEDGRRLYEDGAKALGRLMRDRTLGAAFFITRDNETVGYRFSASAIR